MSTVDEQLPPPPQPPQPHRISTRCDRHPDEHFTGFCPSCLCDRLSVLDHSSAANASTTAAAGRKSASSGLKSIFRSSAAANGNAVGDRNTLRTRPESFLPELRRSQSFSVGNNSAGLGFAGVFEPQRKSCDVRGRNTLWSLFSQDDGKRAAAAANCALDAASSSSKAGIGTGNDRVEGKISSCNGFVVELKEERRDCERDVVFEQEEEEREQAEIEEIIASNNSVSNPKLSSEDKCENLEAEKLNSKQMKTSTDLDSQTKKAAGGFWSAASVFSKKLKAWTRKNNKTKKHIGGRTVQVEKKSNAGRNYRETQSEVADYGNGRRSIDIDPRFSVDAGRMSLDCGRISFDDPRYSFDEPRASWDGHLIGGGRLNSLSRMGLGVAPMVSVMEDRPCNLLALRKDNLIPLEEPRRSIHEEEGVPGGAAETKDYYLDSSSSRRRKSLDRSSSARRISAAVVAEMDEMRKSGPCNAKVTPAAVDTGSAKGIEGFRESTSVIGSSNDRNKVVKKPRSWRSWNIWGLIARRATNKDEDDDDDACNRENEARRSYSGVNPRDAFSSNVFRSNSSVSWRSSHSHSMSGTIGGTSRGHEKKMSNGFVLERNPSARHSPNHAENGHLRFYTTTPMRGSRRGPTVKAKEAGYSHTMAGTGSMLF